MWEDLDLVLNIQNLADRRPPFLAIPAGVIAIGRSAIPFDGTNASAVGRYVSRDQAQADFPLPAPLASAALAPAAATAQ
jgi:hypothetical protein